MDDIRQASKQTRPLASREEAAYLGLQLAAETLRARFNDLFKARDLTGSQYNVLRILRGAGTAGLPCREIGERMINRDSDITRMLDRLETRGLIKRERRTDDRRVVLTYITENGAEVLSELDGPVSDLHGEQLGHLTEKELKTLIGLLGKVRKAGQ